MARYVLCIRLLWISQQNKVISSLALLLACIHTMSIIFYYIYAL